MKILHIVPFFYGSVGTVTKELTQELSKLGTEVVIASPANPPSEVSKYIYALYRLRKTLIEEPIYTSLFVFLNKDIIKKDH